MLLVLTVLVGVASAVAQHGAVILKSENSLTLQNGFIKAIFQTSSSAWVSELYGDFQGQGAYGKNLLSAGGLRLERENSDGSVVSGTDGAASAKEYVAHSDDNCAQITFPAVYDASENPTVEEKWEFSLCKGDRSLKFRTSGSLLSSTTVTSVRSIHHALYSTPLSTTAFFDQGVVQIMSAGQSYSHFGSADRMRRMYAMGGDGAIDVLRDGAVGGENDQVVLLNRAPGVDTAYTSGFQEILVGNFSDRDYWIAGSSDADTVVSPLPFRFVNACGALSLTILFSLHLTAPSEHRRRGGEELAARVADLAQQPQFPLCRPALGPR
jgi:hypothetical protein